MHHAFAILKTNEPQKVKMLHLGISEISQQLEISRVFQA